MHDTSKGRVGHFAPPLDAVRRADENALPGWIVFPRYRPDAQADMAPLPRGQALMRLIENAFNYNVHRHAGFETLANLVQASACHTFDYSNLNQAVTLFDRMADNTLLTGESSGSAA